MESSLPLWDCAYTPIKGNLLRASRQLKSKARTSSEQPRVTSMTSLTGKATEPFPTPPLQAIQQFATCCSRSSTGPLGTTLFWGSFLFLTHRLFWECVGWKLQKFQTQCRKYTNLTKFICRIDCSQAYGKTIRWLALGNIDLKRAVYLLNMDTYHRHAVQWVHSLTIGLGN